jgi:hypothetical protein
MRQMPAVDYTCADLREHLSSYILLITCSLSDNATVQDGSVTRHCSSLHSADVNPLIGKHAFGRALSVKKVHCLLLLSLLVQSFTAEHTACR